MKTTAKKDACQAPLQAVKTNHLFQGKNKLRIVHKSTESSSPSAREKTSLNDEWDCSWFANYE